MFSILTAAAGIIDEAKDKVSEVITSGEIGEIVDSATDMVDNAAGIVGDAADKVAGEIEKLTAAAHISSATIIAALLLIFILLLRKPLKTAVKIAVNTGIGYVALFLVNFIGGEIGVNLPITWLNALVVGVLGIPGVAILFFIEWMMRI